MPGVCPWYRWGQDVRYHTQVEILYALDAAARGPFDRAAWFGLLARHGNAPTVLETGSGPDRTAMILREGPSGWSSYDHMFAFGWRPLGNADPAALASMARSLQSRTPVVTLDKLETEHDTATLLRDAFRSAGWFARLERTGTNHVLDLQDRDFAQYWERRPGPLRTTVKRKRNKVRIEIHETFDPAAWLAYAKVYGESWKPEEAQFDLLTGFARAEAALGHVRIGLAYLGDAPVAAQFWTVENGTAYIHKLAYDAAYRNLSAGTVLSASMFEHVIDNDRVARIDFGTGDDQYKRDWMDKALPVMRLTCVDWRQRAGLSFLARAAGRKLASRLASR